MDFSNQDLARAGLLEPAWRHRLMEQAVLQIEKPSAEETQQALQVFCQQIQVQDQQQLQAWLQLRGLSGAELEAMAQLPVRWRKWCEQRYATTVEHEYLRRKAEFDEVTYSLLRLRDGELAAELHQQLQEGEVSFEALASSFLKALKKIVAENWAQCPFQPPIQPLPSCLKLAKRGSSGRQNNWRVGGSLCA